LFLYKHEDFTKKSLQIQVKNDVPLLLAKECVFKVFPAGLAKYSPVYSDF